MSVSESADLDLPRAPRGTDHCPAAGKDAIPAIVKWGGIKWWRPAERFQQDAYFNLCLPIRPAVL